MGYNTRREAELQAIRYLHKMHGKGWYTRVWENVGWHWCLHNGPVNVNASHSAFGPPTFWAMVSPTDGGSGGLAAWSPDHKHFRDPNKAARHAIKAARRYVDSLDSVVKMTEKIYD